MTLPIYFLRRLGMPRGHRLTSSKPPEEVVGTCPACHKPVFRKTFLGVKQVTGIYHGTDYYHYGCQPIQEWETYHRHQSDKVRVELGNLSQEEYRYWIGYVAKASTWAQCRACRTVTYSAREREEHFKDKNFLVGGNQCTVRLVNAYKIMLTSTLCVVCKQQRWGGQKWGVPLCDRPECEKLWKFDMTKWAALAYQLDRQERAAKAVAEGKVGIVTGDVFVDGEKLTRRPFCQMCHMWADTKEHENLHALRIQSGDYEAMD